VRDQVSGSRRVKLSAVGGRAPEHLHPCAGLFLASEPYKLELKIGDTSPREAGTRWTASLTAISVVREMKQGEVPEKAGAPPFV
jgi:hypothetical protein